MQIGAEIIWNREPDEDFGRNRYSRRHLWRFDGLEVLASSSPEVVPPPMSDPAAIDPEEAFVASLSSCHMLWFLAIAAKRGFEVESYSDQAVGVMEKDTDGRTWITRVTLRPQVVWNAPNIPSKAMVDGLHHQAHAECFIANSVRTEVTIEPIDSDE